MNLWRLTLAPHKCSQITFSKAACRKNDDLDIQIYNQKISYDLNPKFLGIIFDPRMNFESHMEMVKSKIFDRINVLKVLAYDRNWSLKTNYLVNVYKVLVRSVMDYANVISGACDKQVIKDFEILQNTALRVIFKVSLLDHVSIETLREWAGVESIETRHSELLNDYYVKCLTSSNPLIKDVFKQYELFKKRNFLREELAIGEGGTVDMATFDLIKNHNYSSLHNEKYLTTLCKAKWVVKEFLTDGYGFGPIGSSFR